LIALDSSAFARFLAGEVDRASSAAGEAISARDAHLPPVVLTELLSNPLISPDEVARVLAVPLLPLHEGYWGRAAFLRAELIRSRFKANVADCLIAQSCLDHDIPLITYDHDFRHFVRVGLKLV
jgi:predicted nucleic acid-binding protein